MSAGKTPRDMGVCLSHHQVDVTSQLYPMFTENSIGATDSSEYFTEYILKYIGGRHHYYPIIPIL